DGGDMAAVEAGGRGEPDRCACAGLAEQTNEQPLRRERPHSAVLVPRRECPPHREVRPRRRSERDRAPQRRGYSLLRSGGERGNERWECHEEGDCEAPTGHSAEPTPHVATGFLPARAVSLCTVETKQLAPAETEDRSAFAGVLRYYELAKR